MFNELISAGSRQLQGRPETDPQFFVDSGGTVDRDPGLRKREPTREELEDWEAIYKEGGAVAKLIDARALMTFGVGTEWVTRDEDRTIEYEGETVNPAQYLERRLPTRHRDTTIVRIGTQCYWAGNGYVELVNDRRGEFAELDPVNPVTIEALYDDNGTIGEWVQTVRASRFGEELTQRVNNNAQLAHFSLYRHGRNPLGLSEVARNWDEIQRYRRNQESIQTALEAHAFVKWHVLAHGPLDDQDIRRIRQRFNNIRNENTYVTAEDIEINALDTGSIGEGIDNIAKRDVQNLAMGFFFPIEWTQWSGSDGLGTGTPAEGRKIAFENQARGEQRIITDQFLQQVARPLIEESDFNDTVHVDLSWGDVIADQQGLMDYVQNNSWAFHRDEVRDVGDFAAWDTEDAEKEAPPELDPNAERGGGDGAGGLFDQLSMRGPDSDFRQRELSESPYNDWEAVYHDIYDRVLWGVESDRQLFEFDPEEVPQFVIDNLREAINAEALFDRFESIPEWAARQVGDVLLDSLETRHGWSIDSIVDNLQSMALGLDKHDAETIARTETQALVNKAREQGYTEQFGDAATFRWVGPDDHRTTDACEWIKAQIDDSEGVPMERLKALVQEAPEHDEDVNTEPREFTPHINCRHTFVRVVN